MNANSYGRLKFHVVESFVLAVVLGHRQEPQSVEQDTSSTKTRAVQSNLLASRFIQPGTRSDSPLGEDATTYSLHEEMTRRKT